MILKLCWHVEILVTTLHQGYLEARELHVKVYKWIG